MSSGLAVFVQTVPGHIFFRDSEHSQEKALPFGPQTLDEPITSTLP
jgi:hypothetical protein